jgi:hypothetical protein
MKKLFVSASLALSLALGVLATACSGPNSALPGASNAVRTISAGGGAGNPSSFPQPPLLPGVGDCVKMAPISSNVKGAITNINGKLSATSLTIGFSATSCDAEPETIGVYYTVSGGPTTTSCGNIPTPVQAGQFTINGNGGRGFSISLPVPNCPATTAFYTVNVQAFIPNGPNAGQLLSTTSAGFEVTDLTNNSPGVQNGVLHLTGTFVPDPASSPLASSQNELVTYGLPFNSAGQVDWHIVTGYQNGFLAAYLNGTYWGYNNLGMSNIDLGTENFTTDFRTAQLQYLQPCDPTQGPILCGVDGGGFNTLTELHAGDKIEWFPIANDPSSGVMSALFTSNGIVALPTIVGPRLGSAVMQLVAN